VKVFGPEFPIGLPDTVTEIATGSSTGGQSSAVVPAPRATGAAGSTSPAVLLDGPDISLQLLPPPGVGEKIPASALPPEARVLFTDAQMAMGTFGRTRLFLDQVLTATPGTAAFSPSVMQAVIGPDTTTVTGHAVQQLLQNGGDPGALNAGKAADGPQMLLIVRDPMTGERYRLQAPVQGATGFRPAPGDLLTLYWAGLSMEGPLRGLYLRHDRSGDGLLLADLTGLARSWRKRILGLIQAGLLFLLIVGVFLGLAIVAGMSSDSSESLTAATLILGSLLFLLYLGVRG